jgi:hypothetical protein
LTLGSNARNQGEQAKWQIDARKQCQ